MNLSHLSTSGWKNAIIGMRFPKNSEKDSDSKYMNGIPVLGEKDYDLMRRLIKAGRDHRKFLRMIHVQFAINMPISWWIQFDTYKVGTTANSRSRMHKFGTSYLTIDDFQVEDPEDEQLKVTIQYINSLIYIWRTDEDAIMKKLSWKKAIDILPQSYMQERMVDLNMEVLLTICKARKGEKLSKEWDYFINTLLNIVPYLDVFYSFDNKNIDDISWEDLCVQLTQ